MCTYIVTRGSKESALFNQIFTVAKLVTLVFIGMAAFTYFNADNFTPFLHPKYGWGGTVKGAAIIFFAFLGFDFITCLAEESRNAERDVPKAIELTITACGLIYCCMAGSLSGMARLEILQPETAMAQAFEQIGNRWMTFVIYVSAFLGITASAFT
jgi:APA family basic amino acid/polyamine antiporter